MNNWKKVLQVISPSSSWVLWVTDCVVFSSPILLAFNIGSHLNYSLPRKPTDIIPRSEMLFKMITIFDLMIIIDNYILMEGLFTGFLQSLENSEIWCFIFKVLNFGKFIRMVLKSLQFLFKSIFVSHFQILHIVQKSLMRKQHLWKFADHSGLSNRYIFLAERSSLLYFIS